MNYLVVGLGNIGAEYAETRHNMGFMALDTWAQEANAIFVSGRYGSTAEISYKGRKFILLKPSTYMNLSGKAVRYWMNELKLPLENLIVISDDLNLPFGTLRMRKNGSAGGHNGLANITEMLGTQDYARIRMGIGNDFSRGGQVDFVLGRLSKEEMEQMPAICQRVIEGVKTFATAGPDRAMNSVNTRSKTVEQN
ncbi:MAG: aminoacyl-tRNA hydrolase [Bacteroidetes bacterium]|uniref:Peptidyl-tRNA hydrolase n=1 Tax=Candidatus Cryptobacteroides intestinigallinarum TaxID=2840767 RepID=A0A9D9N0Z7_9BACT|nr:aminoacyl-tRNA hydrolase [Candidatus Cryptobacteroides intestinigallinarum]